MRIFRAVLLAAALAGACSSSSPTPPTQNDPPSITCPAAVSITATTSGPTTVAFGTPTVVQGTAPVTTACTPASGSAFAAGATTVTCTATDAIQRKSSCAFTVTVVSGPQLSVTRFIAFGDSITYGEDGQDYGGECPNEPQVFRPLVQVAAPYPSVLQLNLDTRYTIQRPTVVNDGLRGEAASDPATLTRFQNNVVATLYDVVLLMEGANDLGGHEDAAIAGLGSMIDYGKSQGLRVFLATIPPENPNAPSYCPSDRGGDASLVSPFNARVRALAATKSVTLVDVEVAFGGNLSLLSLDGLHPTPTGYSVIANAFFAAIKATLEK